MKNSSTEFAESGSAMSAGDDGAAVVLNPEDPMNWSWWRKHSILACISLLGGLGTYAGLFIVPA